MFLFTDPLRFYPFVQNHFCSIKLRQFSITCIRKLKNDLLIKYILKYEGVHSILAMTVVMGEVAMLHLFIKMTLGSQLRLLASPLP